MIIGIIAAVVMIPGLLPLLGWLNWLVAVLCVTGIAFGAVADDMSGMAVNGAVLLVSLVRLSIGSGILQGPQDQDPAGEPPWVREPGTR